MRICLICFSDAGARLAERLCGALGLGRADVHTIEKYAKKYGFTAHGTVRGDMVALFKEYDALIFLCACGIAVRDIAPHIAGKTVDPAVLVMDDHGRYVIPLLSGHIGGANALAHRVADATGARAVITTATDIAGKFSCDAWAAEHGCAVSSMELAKQVSAAILTRDIAVASEFPLPESLPDGLVRGDGGELGIYIGIRTATPFASAVRLIPRIVTVGIGCKRGATEEAIYDAVTELLKRNDIDIRAVRSIASIDIKRDEAGLLACAEKMGVPAVFFDADTLNRAEGDFYESEFVRSAVGTGSVCERAAVCAGGTLIARRTAVNGVTAAASAEEWRVEL